MGTTNAGGEEPDVYRLPTGAFHVSAAPDAAGAAEVPSGSVDAATAPAAAEDAPPGRAPRPTAPPRVRPVPTETALEEAEHRPPRPIDLAVTTLLLILQTIASLVASAVAFSFVSVAQSCSAVTCSFGQLNVGLWIAIVSPTALLAVALVGSVWLMLLRRPSFWVPLAATVVAGGLWLLGVVLVGGAL